MSTITENDARFNQFLDDHDAIPEWLRPIDDDGAWNWDNNRNWNDGSRLPPTDDWDDGSGDEPDDEWLPAADPVLTAISFCLAGLLVGLLIGMML